MLVAEAAVTAWGRMRREGPQGEGGGLGSGAQCAGPTENRGLLLARRKMLLGHWSAALALSLLGDSRNPAESRDREATPAPLILDAFSHESPADATGKARGQLLTMARSLVVGEQHKEVVSASQAAGSCAFSSDSVVPKEQGKHRRVRETQLLCQQAYQLLRRALI